MPDVEFNPNEREFIASVGREEKQPAITALVMKLSFGLVKSKQQANIVMIAIIILAFSASVYFLIDAFGGVGGVGAPPPAENPNLPPELLRS